MPLRKTSSAHARPASAIRATLVTDAILGVRSTNLAVTFRHTVQAVLKRGALVAAANWPVTLIQSVADSLFQLLIAAPLLGGIFLVALVVGAEPQALLSLDARELAATIVGSLLSHPLVLAAFLLAMAVVIAGGSLFVFLVKAGTVATLVAGERQAGPIEAPPLHWHVVTQASAFSVEGFTGTAQALFPRYAQLGVALMVVYLASAAAYLAVVVSSRAWGTPALLTAVFVAWITAVNLMYLLIQIVIAADDCGVATALRRAIAFVRDQRRTVASVFAVILVMVVLATGASVAGIASLGLITFVPFVGPLLALAVLPLQLLALLLRAIVFQYIGLASVGAYVKLYREFSAAERQVNTAPRYPVWGPA
jgi:hypothetical protein